MIPLYERPPAFASRIARQMRSGVAGMSKCATPACRIASSTAFMSAGSEPLTPASPTPFAPSGFVAVGTGCSRIASPSTRPAQELAGVGIVHGVLAEHLPRPLGDPALHLAFDDLMIDDVAGVVHRGEAHDLGDPRLRLDLDFGDVAAVGKGHAELALGFHVERTRGAGVFFRERREAHRAVGAPDSIGAVREFDVRGGRLEIPGRER